MSKLHYQQPLLETPFHPRTSALCETNQWQPWAGYTTVGVFTEVENEYFAVRNQATLFDLSPMIKYRIRGADSEAYLNRLVTRDVKRIKPGRVSYVAWCDDRGKVLDDGTLFRFAKADFRLCCQERHLEWLLDSALGFEVTVEDESEAIAGLALQGPTSYSVLRTLGVEGIETLRPFEHREVTLSDIELSVSRTGFTGDLGYELWVDPNKALELWDRLMSIADRYPVRPIGSLALDLVRIEAGFIMTNADFVSSAQALRPSRGRSPFEIGLDWLVDFDKGHFNGRRALLQERETGPKRILVGLDIEGNKPSGGALVYHRKNKEVGHITSAMWSPTCKRNIALASLHRPYGDRYQGDLWVDIYVHKELEWERQMARCRIVPRPFFDPPRRRATPPHDY